MKFMIGLLVVFFALWLAGGGPQRQISFTGPYLKPFTGPGDQAEAYGDPNSFSAIRETISVGPGGIKISSDHSPYVGNVSISRDLSGARKRDALDEYVSISVSSSDSPVSIAGWRIMNHTGAGAVLPQGTLIPTTGRVNELAPITLSPGDTIIISTGRSPIGISFKENLCTGYLEDTQDFHPSLSQHCPAPTEEFDRFYRGRDEEACREALWSVSYCSASADLPSSASRDCKTFVDTYLDYNGCVAAHRNDADFPGTTWRAYLGLDTQLWNDTTDTITLVDAEGRIIDSVSY